MTAAMVAPVRALAMLLLLGTGCATAMPTLSGASTTPHARTDLMVGGAARVPLANLRERGPMESRYREAAESGGVVPVAAFRHGIGRHRDLGVTVAGTSGRLELRGETGVQEGSTRPAWVWALGLVGGYLPDHDGAGSGGRVGLDVPVVYGIDFGALYDVWVGARAQLNLLVGDFANAADTSARATVGMTSVGAVIGMAAGFRRVHALLEVTVAYEAWFGSHGDQRITRHGLALTPAFALRVRL